MSGNNNRPVAICTVCHAYSSIVTAINERCGNRYNGKRCQGVWRSALNEEDWQACPSCNATGREIQGRCKQCDGFGWIYCRK
jgi:DnaJ-class molecular chaperone